MRWGKPLGREEPRRLSEVVVGRPDALIGRVSLEEGPVTGASRVRRAERSSPKAASAPSFRTSQTAFMCSLAKTSSQQTV